MGGVGHLHVFFVFLFFNDFKVFARVGLVELWS